MSNIHQLKLRDWQLNNAGLQSTGEFVCLEGHAGGSGIPVEHGGSGLRSSRTSFSWRPRLKDCRDTGTPGKISVLIFTWETEE
jgi:hypothetical protein